MKRRLIRKIASWFLIIVFQFSTFQSLVVAQELTPSAEPTNNIESTESGILNTPSPDISPTGNPSPTPAEIIDEGQTVKDTSIPPIFNSILDNSSKVSQSAAIIRGKRKIRSLIKKDFQAKESIEILVENAKPDEVGVSITNSAGENVEVVVEEEQRPEGVEVSVVPPKEMKPGKYTLEIETAGQISRQDFTWGVLALNTNKSVYSPQEQANFALAVLDKKGQMVCDADLSLEISNPAGQKDTLTTAGGEIKVNEQCARKELSLIPDFEASYLTGDIGKYSIRLTATTKDGIFSVTDSFETRESVPFDVERIAPTRIYPPLDYPVTIKVTANQDFEGQITEVVPFDFNIKESTQEGTLPYDKLLYGPTTKEGATQEKTVSLRFPYEGERKMGLGFGHEPDDLLLQSKYELGGVEGHDGVDFEMAMGESVLAVADGKVALAQVDGDYGTTVVLEHEFGKTYYGHLSSYSVAEGQEIKAGEELGKVGVTGLSTGPHLHFGFKPKEDDFNNGYFGKVDPLLYFGKEFRATTSTPIYENSRVKLITWKVSMKKGETVTLAYTFKAPEVSPQFYLTGPLSFKSNNSTQPVFEELRQWQIAADVITTTLTYIDGFEHQTVSNPAAFGAATTQKIFNNVAGNVTIDTTTVKHGTASLRTQGAAAAGNADKALPNPTGSIVASFYWYPDSGTTSTEIVSIRSSSILGYIFLDGDEDLMVDCGPGASTTWISNFALTQMDTWHHIDLILTLGATRTMDGYVDGVAMPQCTDTGTGGEAATRFVIGSAAADTFDYYYDDLLISFTAGDFPIGEHEVKSLVPTGEGTHNAGTDGMENAAGDDINGTTVQAFPLVDEWPVSTDRIQQNGTGSTEYAEVTFNDVSDTTIWGVEGIMAGQSAGTLTNNGTTRIVDSSNNTLTNIYSGDMSETTIRYVRDIISDPGADGWSQSELNGVKARVGFSTDGSPIPYWESLMLQYATPLSPSNDQLMRHGKWFLDGVRQPFTF